MRLINWNKVREQSQYLLLTTILFFILITPLFTSAVSLDMAGNISFSLIILLSTLSLQKPHTWMYSSAVIIIILHWLGSKLGLRELRSLSSLVKVLFFFFISIKFILQVAKSKKVNLEVVIEALDGYLLLGIAGTLLYAICDFIIPFSINFPTEGPKNLGDFIYFSFINLTTVGFGEITPVSQLARSISIFLSLTGQFYLTVVMALIIGKFLQKS